MQPLTSEGLQKIREISQRYGLSENAVMSMLQSVLNGGGTMAQFNIQELGGGGQWMRGGMTMVGDMFNHSLKNTVNNLCGELSQLIYSYDIFEKQSPNTNIGTGANLQGQTYGIWWPSEFGSPSSSGGQNNMRYAYFPPPVRRLVIEVDGNKTIYDTLDHQISGVSQQQSGSGYTFQLSSQFGYVDIRNLPLINPEKPKHEPQIETTSFPEPQTVYTQAPQQTQPEETKPESSASESPLQGSSSEEDIVNTIERLAGLMTKGIITESEFNDKKKELLKRL